MKRLWVVVLGMLIAAAACFGGAAAEVTLRGRLGVPGLASAPTSTMVLDGEPRTLSRVDGSFSIDGVAPGIHVLEAASPMFDFPVLTVSVSEDGQILGTFLFNKKRREMRHPFVLQAVSRPVYFEPRKTISVMSILGNPMLLMMGFMLLVTYALPKLQEGMDPEELKKMQEEMKKNQASQPDPQKMLSNLFGGGGATADDSDSD